MWAAVSATFLGRLRLLQTSVILASTIERPRSWLLLVLILLCHFFIFSTVARIVGSRYLPCESRISMLVSVERPRSWSVRGVGEPTRTLLLFSAASIPFRSGPSSAEALVTHPQDGQTCSPFSVSPITLLPQFKQ